MSSGTLDDNALKQLATLVGLEKIYNQDPALVRKAYDNGRAMADRLQRPDDIADEPAHIYQANNNV
jgi:hypothetical protein